MDNKPYILVIVGVMLVSFSAIFIRMSNAPSVVIAFYRLFFTALFLTPLFLSKGMGELRKIGKRDFILSVLSGTSLAFHFFAFISSLQYTSVTSSTVLVTIHPIFVGLGSIYLLKEKIPRGFVTALIISLSGSILISLSDAGQGQSAFWGDLLAFLGALLMTCYILLGRTVRQRVSLATYTYIVYLSSTIVLFILTRVMRSSLWPYEPREWMLFIAMALVCTVFGHTILNWALKYLKPTFISTSILGEPVFATILALIIFGEFPGIFQMVGGIIVILGLYKLIAINRQPLS